MPLFPMSCTGNLFRFTKHSIKIVHLQYKYPCPNKVRMQYRWNKDWKRLVCSSGILFSSCLISHSCHFPHESLIVFSFIFYMSPVSSISLCLFLLHNLIFFNPILIRGFLLFFMSPKMFKLLDLRR